jgi:hypothetical protein
VEESARPEIDRINAIVAELGYEQPMAAEIHGHVIDPPADMGERNRSPRHQRLTGAGSPGRRGQRGTSNAQDERDYPRTSFLKESVRGPESRP